MRSTLLFLLFQIIVIGLCAQGKPAYRLYNAKGKKVSYKKMIKKISKSDILLFGELHDNKISHWLQFEVTKDLAKNNELILGAEMYEADNQIYLSQYLKDVVTYDQLDSLARLWSNDKTDYLPLVNFAKEKGIDVVATNIPRRYANLVYRKGFEALDTLTSKEKSWIAPLPILFDPDLTSYKSILQMMGDHGTPELVKAQAIKDATMAHFILQHYQSGKLFIHYNGAFHSDIYEGIMWYLKQQRSGLEYATITTVSQKDVNKLHKENKGKADFIICVDDDMTSTY